MAARAGMRSVAFVPRGTPAERLYPVYALGSTVVVVDDEVDPIVDRVAAMAEDGDVYVSSTARSSNPYQAEGTKTIAYELAEQGGVPDWVVVPVGGGGTIAGVWRGFRDLLRLGWIDRLPRLLGVVPRDYNALEIAFERGLDDPRDAVAAGYAPPPTDLVKIAHVHPPDGAEGLAAVRDSGGLFVSVTDEEALDAQRRLGRDEGLYVEPSAAATVAGLDRALGDGTIDGDERVVAILSGSGFRETFVSAARRPIEHRTISLDEVPDVLAEQLAREAL
jgi:threonine synthase